jgi:hypothetical protein
MGTTGTNPNRRHVLLGALGPAGVGALGLLSRATPASAALFSGADEEPAVDAAAGPPGPYVPQVQSEASAAASVTVLRVRSPFAGFEPFGVYSRSFPNADGTWNHGTFLGWNAAVNAGLTPTADRPSLTMGFENNYYDHVGDGRHGAEWYIDYHSPDHTSVVNLRPFYTRIYNEDDDQNSAVITMDIGGTNGQYTVKTWGSSLLHVTDSSVTMYRPVQVNANFLGISTDQQAVLKLASPTAPSIVFGTEAANGWYLQSFDLNTFVVSDRSWRPHIVLTQGATPAAANTNLLSGLRVHGPVRMVNGVEVTVTAGQGSPEGRVSAPVGSLYLRADGGPGNSLYVKESGTGSSGWIQK